MVPDVRFRPHLRHVRAGPFRLGVPRHAELKVEIAPQHDRLGFRFKSPLGHTIAPWRPFRGQGKLAPASGFRPGAGVRRFSGLLGLLLPAVHASWGDGQPIVILSPLRCLRSGSGLSDRRSARWPRSGDASLPLWVSAALRPRLREATVLAVQQVAQMALAEALAGQHLGIDAYLAPAPPAEAELTSAPCPRVRVCSRLTDAPDRGKNVSAGSGSCGERRRLPQVRPPGCFLAVRRSVPQDEAEEQQSDDSSDGTVGPGIVYRIGEGAGPSAARGAGSGAALRHRSAAQGVGIGRVVTLIIDVVVTS